jgi:hypothetical protein
VFDPGLEQKSGPAFSSVVMGSIFAPPGKNPRAKTNSARNNPAPGAGLIAGQGPKSRQMGWKNGHFEGFGAKNGE